MSATVPTRLDVEAPVRGRLQGCRTIELARGVGADALAPIRAAPGS